MYKKLLTVQVETIGDAYMVVSGLPERNGNAHSGEIGNMSLEIIRRLEHFKMKAIPEQRIMVRIGLHTGPVCAGRFRQPHAAITPVINVCFDGNWLFVCNYEALVWGWHFVKFCLDHTLIHKHKLKCLFWDETHYIIISNNKTYGILNLRLYPYWWVICLILSLSHQNSQTLIKMFVLRWDSLYNYFK